MCAGNIGRLAGPVLAAKQGSDDPVLDPHQVHTLRLLSDIVQTAPPRDILCTLMRTLSTVFFASAG